MQTIIMRANKRKCAKCGSSPSEDPTISLHRFPQPSKATKSRCELWAKFCYPDRPWSSVNFQKRLYHDHKMLCDKHFKKSSFHNDTQLNSISVLDKALHSKKQDIIVQTESKFEGVLEIKIEPDDTGNESEETVSLSNYVETRSQRKKRAHESTLPEEPPIKLPNHKPPTNKDVKSSSKIQSPKKEPYTILQKNHRKNENSPKDTNNASSISAKQFQKELDNATDAFFSRQSKYEQNDECDLYGKLLNRKLRTYSLHERRLIMFKIDGLLIEYPPGFDSSTSTELDNSKKAMPKSGTELHLNASSIKTRSSTKSKSTVKSKETNKLTTSLPFEETSSPNQPSEAAQVSSTSMPSTSPDRSLTKVKGSTNQAVKVSSSIQYPIKVTSSIPNQPVKVLSSIPQQRMPTDAHKPLQITIPETKVVPFTRSKFVPPTSSSRGIIKIIKAKASSKYVPSAQPPILITVPSSASLGHRSTDSSDVNALEHLSSVASTRFPISFETEEIEMVEDMDVVSHEVILESSQEDMASQNIVETALKYAHIGDNE